MNVYVFSFLVVLVVMNSQVPVVHGGFIGDCWATWSRCSKWSNFLTGVLWKTCNERCIDLGHTGGDCVEVKSNCPLSDKAWQCQCSG
uniref:Antibacterial peptide n=1 Tax=Cyclina sinensis TaxID=120566 RepID=U3KTS1_CYCSN|nr:antibacterial peptide [Cyclina sinensis]